MCDEADRTAEFDDEAFVDTPEYRETVAGSSEARRWELYKATPNTASA